LGFGVLGFNRDIYGVNSEKDLGVGVLEMNFFERFS